jgi:hypothetical protein
LVLWRGAIWLVAGYLPLDPWWIFDWSLPAARPFDKAPRSQHLKKIASLPLWLAMVAGKVGMEVDYLVSFQPDRPWKRETLCRPCFFL